MPSHQIAISPKTCIVDWISKTLPSPQKTSLEPNNWLVTCSHTVLPYLSGLWITLPKAQVKLSLKRFTI